MARKKSQVAQEPKLSPEEETRQHLLNSARVDVETSIDAMFKRWRQDYEETRARFAKDFSEFSPRHTIDSLASSVVRLQEIVTLVSEVETVRDLLERRVKRDLLMNRFTPNGTCPMHNAIRQCQGAALYDAMSPFVMLAEAREKAIKELLAAGLTLEQIQPKGPTAVTG